MKSAVDARRVAQNAIALAVREARAADWSWDKISAALGGTPNGETLRRNFGGEKELPGVTPPRGSPPHPQGAQEEGDEEHANAGEQQVQQALHDNAHDTQRHRHDHQQ